MNRVVVDFNRSTLVEIITELNEALYQMITKGRTFNEYDVKSLINGITALTVYTQEELDDAIFMATHSNGLL